VSSSANTEEDVTAEVASMLWLEERSHHRYLASNLPGPAPVVFGGQILAQTVVAAGRSAPDKVLKSLHTVFARGAAPTHPLEIDVEAVQEGRTFSSFLISVHQGDRVCAQSVAMLHDPDSDLIRHGGDLPPVDPPENLRPRTGGHDWWELRVVDDVDLQDPDDVGPAEVNIWSRFSEVPDEPSADQALLAFASDGFLISTAMRPHRGIGQAMAHYTISTTVVAQTISFHEEFDASDWLLLAHHSPYAGRGRSFGRADVFTTDGRLVASYSQENMIRSVPDGQGATSTGERSKY
jgi:acyl-CoA thioesterase